ncbi:MULTISPECIES: MFS transporter [Mycetocola]|uniref:uridine transporter UriT n=1 Tax=Mycetocola TaxID=76634 RepID=UPI00165D1BAF|nr:MFS transporter [Mycetocola sp. JXN-3]
MSTPLTSRGTALAPQAASVTALMVALLASCFAFQLNASMLSPALVTIEHELGATGAQVALTQTAFFTSAALTTLFLPRLGDLIGRRKVLVSMLIVMALGCVIAALATNIPMLLIGRVIQGASGPVVPMCLLMLRSQVTEPKKYGTLLGVVTAVNGGIAGVDALAGGWLAGNFGFASIFWVMGAVALLAAIFVRFMAPESLGGTAGKMDWWGSALLVISVGAALIMINEIGNLAAANWALVAILAVVTAVSFWLFWRLENRSAHPLVAPAQLKHRSTWALASTSLLTLAGVFAVMNGILPALAQDTEVGLGLGAGEVAWWTLTPYALAGLLMGPVSGRLAASFGYLRMLRIGLSFTVLGIVAMVFTVGSDIRVIILLLSIAIGISYAGIGNIMINGLGVVLSPKEAPGSLPGLNTGAINLGAGVSFAVIYAVQTAFSGGGTAAGYQAAMVAGAILLVGALLMSSLIPRPTNAEISR